MNEYRWEDIHLGMKTSFEASFTDEMLRQFAGISGDTNPLHTDAAFAHAQGFPGPVVFGLMTSSLYSRLVGLYLPGKYALLQGLDIHFTQPCFVGQILQVEGEVSYRNEAYHCFEIRARIRDTEGQVISKAKIRVGFQRAGSNG